MSSLKIIATANKGRKVKKRFIEPPCSSREADETDDTNDDPCGDSNASTKHEEKVEEFDIATATQEMVRFLNEFLEEEWSEIREINKQCSRLTTILLNHHYAEVEEVNHNLEVLLVQLHKANEKVNMQINELSTENSSLRDQLNKCKFRQEKDPSSSTCGGSNSMGGF